MPRSELLSGGQLRLELVTILQPLANFAKLACLDVAVRGMSMMARVFDEHRVDEQARRVRTKLLHHVPDGNGADVVAVQKMRGRERLGADLIEDVARTGPGREQLGLFFELGAVELLLVAVFERSLDRAAVSHITDCAQDFGEWLIQIDRKAGAGSITRPRVAQIAEKEN